MNPLLFFEVFKELHWQGYCQMRSPKEIYKFGSSYPLTATGNFATEAFTWWAYLFTQKSKIALNYMELVKGLGRNCAIKNHKTLISGCFEPEQAWFEGYIALPPSDGKFVSQISQMYAILYCNKHQNPVQGGTRQDLTKDGASFRYCQTMQLEQLQQIPGVVIQVTCRLSPYCDITTFFHFT